MPVDGVLGARRIASQAYVGGGTGLAICLLLMLGACGKSAQFPLHVWLPDAMEGPTPVSALIHAATMVTAGVYMVTRCTPLFTASPDAQLVVAAIGTFTALLAGLIALTQFDLKRVLAYSTVSQLGYMFLGLGTGTLAGISAGMFHLFTHAFFKALLFLGAGSVMHAMGNVIDMRRFGGLRKVMPTTYWTFLIGCLALSGVAPLSGFWSKDAILASVHAKAHALEHEWTARRETAAAGRRGAAATGVDRCVGGSRGDVAGFARDVRRSACARSGDLSPAVLHGVVCGVPDERLYVSHVVPDVLWGAADSGRGRQSRSRVAAGDGLAAGGPGDLRRGCGVVAGSELSQRHPSVCPAPGRHPVADGCRGRHGGLGEFHLSIAVTSLLIALAGVALSSYLYLGDRRAVQRWQAVMELQPLFRITNGENLVRLARRPWLQAIGAWAGRWRLRWLVRLLFDMVRLIALVLSAPLLLSRFVSPYRLSYGKFFLDELYTALIVAPLRGLACAVRCPG